MNIFHHGRSAKYRIVTDFHIRHANGAAILEWRTPQHHLREVIVLRSYQGFANESVDPLGDDRQTLVYRGAGTAVTVEDKGLQDSVLYFYSVFAFGDDGAWHEQLTTKFRGQEGPGIHPDERHNRPPHDEYWLAEAEVPPSGRL